jgi:hypothetical protein
MRRTTPTIAALCLQAIASLALAQTPAADPAPAADPKPAAAEAAKPRPRPAGTADRLELEATTITGNRELPKVMYVVPWKHADIGKPGARPPDSLLDEVLAPVDREVFSRENRYFRALEGGGNAGIETSVTAGKPAP